MLCDNCDGERDEENNITIIKALPCGHNVCKKCLFKLFNSCSKNNKYKCPDLKCETYLDPNLYFDGFIPKLYNPMCQFCGSTQLVAFTVNEHMEEMEMFSRYKDSIKSKTDIICCKNCSRVFIDKIPRDKLNQLNEITFINLTESGEIRPCPLCNALIYKNGGCHSMNCTVCKNHFFWEKSGNFKNQEEYNIFKSTGGRPTYKYTDSFTIDPNFGRIKNQNKKDEMICCEPNANRKLCKKCGGKIGLLSKDELCFRCKSEKKPKI